MADANVVPGARLREPWHLDKRVPLALIIAIVVQTGGAVWWASGRDRDIDAAGRQITKLQTDVSEQAKAITRLELRSQSLEQGNATIIEQNRQLATDMREATKAIIRLETLMRAEGRVPANGNRVPTFPP